ncbi:alpha/beta fold hydrolase [Falsibacillus pallidus]|uniref:Pimeloyl-ACP methyl ester carboxylesterase n=1 Tax=Falsibacillus pallidus TaxID=493781 RepID=A0A370GVW3_9BACI|nr:alpha/beta hydrolase [Falsibacillus pallidus]RDI47825.1 pimeloyl-ACP methyl ester carboxylesterase [Falsibacillus pallidus]
METKEIQLKKVNLSNGEELGYVERKGTGEKVLLIHGNMTSSKHWDILIERMDPNYHVAAVDLRGFGHSTYNSRVRSIKDFSDDVKLFIDAIGWEEFAVIGWSTGGAVGMQFAADYPGYCEKLILLASASTRGYPFFGTKPSGEPDLENRLKTIEEVEADAGKTLAVQGAYDRGDKDFLKAMWDMLIYTHRKPSEEHYEEYLDDMLTQRNLADVYQSLNLFNISPVHNGLTDGTDQAKRINIPVLVLRGDRDYVVNARMAEEIMEDLGSNAEFKELKDCGHSPLIDDLDQLMQEIHGFLAK